MPGDTARATERRLALLMTAVGIVSRVTPVHTALRNCTRDEGGPFEVGNQVLISSHRKMKSPAPGQGFFGTGSARRLTETRCPS
jgi:hypothetical protein